MTEKLAKKKALYIISKILGNSEEYQLYPDALQEELYHTLLCVDDGFYYPDFEPYDENALHEIIDILENNKYKE